MIAKLHILVDDRNNDFELTEKGIDYWIKKNGEASLNDFLLPDITEKITEIESNDAIDKDERLKLKNRIYESYQVQKERSHCIHQLLKANLMIIKDIDYIIVNGKLVLIDGNTGRQQPGRRYSNGLHQALEAKEGLVVQEETQTYASITLQNFFKLYDRISGMTGTAITEAAEFKSIYDMDVLIVPTHRPNIRIDHMDEMYMTEREKWNAIAKEIKTHHEKGQPILVGTESVEMSEHLSRILKKEKLPHEVLNAKNHLQESEIVAAAGQKGKITVSTNMAGRGTDIKLGDGVKELGGLYVIGAGRNTSRRIDRQLRGRCSRQGDPGSSKFYLSLEDKLMRMFANSTMTNLLQKMNIQEGEPITHSMLSKAIETAQKRIEQRNLQMRKYVLDYDTVLNIQRDEVYKYRHHILSDENIQSLAESKIKRAINNIVKQVKDNHAGKDIERKTYHDFLKEFLPFVNVDRILGNDGHIRPDSIADKFIAAFREKITQEAQKIENISQRYTYLSHAFRTIMLKRLDYLWKLHLLEMDHVREEVQFSSYAQKDPLLEYKNQSFRLFSEFSEKILTDTTQDLFRFTLVAKSEEKEPETSGKTS